MGYGSKAWTCGRRTEWMDAHVFSYSLQFYHPGALPIDIDINHLGCNFINNATARINHEPL